MTPKYDGGPAFPYTDYYDEKPIGTIHGMSLRDWFAGQASIGLTLAASIAHAPLLNTAQLSAAAYQVADALLAERRTS